MLLPEQGPRNCQFYVDGPYTLRYRDCGWGLLSQMSRPVHHFQKNDAEESIIYIYGVVQVEFDKKYAVNMEMQIQT